MIRQQLDFQELPSAALFRRLAAMLYDAFLLFAISVGYHALVTTLKVIAFGPDNLELIHTNALLKWPINMGLIASLMGYYYICWRKQGQTLGMKAWRLRLQQKDGSLATAQQCLKRCPLALISLAAFGLGYFYYYVTPKKACVHDLLTRTTVVVLEKS